MTLKLRCDAKGVIDRFMPFILQALDDNLLTVPEVTELLAREIVNSIRVEVTPENPGIIALEAQGSPSPGVPEGFIPPEPKNGS